MNQVVLAQSAEKMARRVRRPSHPYLIETMPFQITPFLIAPVMPGETLKSALLQAKAVSDPIGNTLIGWHAEKYLFYVKLTDLDDREAFRAMVVDPDYDASSLTTATENAFHFFASSATRQGLDYVSACLDRVVQEYFRDEDETPSSATIDGKYAAKITATSLVDSLRPSSEYDATAVDVDVDLDADSTITASEVSRAQAMWMGLVQQGLTDKSYEDFLRSYGIKPEEQELNRPELIRYLRDWTYPTRLVDPSDGSPVAAVQWALQERVDKARFFREPGFIFGVTCFRPKVYLKNMKGTLSAFLQNGLTWLPGEVQNNIAYGLEAFAAATGPLDAASAAYTLDLRDLMLYGEQFVNMDLTATDKNIVAVPSADATVTKYCSLADVQGLFAGTSYNIEMDGICNMSIASHLGPDLTPPA
jgi:hypothetical protein